MKTNLFTSLMAKVMAPFSPKKLEDLPDWLDCDGRQLTIGLMGEDEPYFSFFEHSGEISTNGLREWLTERNSKGGEGQFFVCVHEGGKRLAFIDNVSVRARRDTPLAAEFVSISVITKDRGLWWAQEFIAFNNLDNWVQQIKITQTARDREPTTEWTCFAADGSPGVIIKR